MGITLTLAASMMLAVNRDPFLGDHTGCHPQPKAEKMHDSGVKIETTVRLATVQKDGDRHDCDVGHHKCVQHDLPPRSLEQTTCGERNDVVHVCV
jgi:hypothetical protein